MTKKETPKKETVKKEQYIRVLLEEYLQRNGLKMSKLLYRGGYFGSNTYDERTVYNSDDLRKLIKEGFNLNEEDIGLWLFNMIWTKK